MGVTSKEAVLRLSVIWKVEVTRSQHGLVWISDLESTLEELDPWVSKRFFKSTFLPSPKFRGNCVCALHGAVLEGFVSVVHGGTLELFCKFYHQAPRIQLHFPSWALSVSSWILVLVDWISGAVITSWWLCLGGKKKPKTFAYSWKDALSVAADEEFTSQPHTLHLTWVQHKAHLPLSSSWLLCRVRLLVSLTVLVWMQTAPPVAKALLCGSHCMPA